MKPLRSVPRTLVRDLKLFAYYCDGEKLALDLLGFDPATPDVERRSPLALAGLLAEASRAVGRRERDACRRGRERCADGLFFAHDSMRNEPGPVGDGLVGIGKEVEHLSRLQRRIWCAIARLGLATAGRAAPEAPHGYTWWRPAMGGVK